jgi:ABC-type multidrug transport system fused ATPase/permease subunit
MPRAAADGPGEPGGADRLVGVETNAVSAWFGTHKVLERVSLTMRAGEVTALIGPSGCGLKPAGIKTGRPSATTWSRAV